MARRREHLAYLRRPLVQVRNEQEKVLRNEQEKVLRNEQEKVLRNEQEKVLRNEQEKVLRNEEEMMMSCHPDAPEVNLVLILI